MKTLHIIFTLILLSIALGSSAWSWDYMYDGSMVPNDSRLGTNKWLTCSDYDPSVASSDGDLLHITNTSTSVAAVYLRYAGPANTPLTMEARVRVTSGWIALYAETPSFATVVGMSPDQVSILASSHNPSATRPVSSEFHTIRIATDEQAQTYVWVDGVFVVHDTANLRYQGNISFFGSCPSDSYWDYVAYSNAFIPLAIPEPSSLLALLAGVGGIGSVAWRRTVRSMKPHR